MLMGGQGENLVIKVPPGVVLTLDDGTQIGE